MLGLTLRELCGRPIAEDVMEFLAEHLLSARQAALRRGFAGASGRSRCVRHFLMPDPFYLRIF